MMKVGVIGLGAMGVPMAMNLHLAGFLRAVWNRTRSRAQALSRETSVAMAESPASSRRGWTSCSHRCRAIRIWRR